MIDDVLLGQATVPDGVELKLIQHGSDFTILLEDNELMSTQANASEEAPAVMTCERLVDRDGPQLLIGGYGMGFTLRAALAVLGVEAHVMVAETSRKSSRGQEGRCRRSRTGVLTIRAFVSSAKTWRCLSI